MTPEIHCFSAAIENFNRLLNNVGLLRWLFIDFYVIHYTVHPEVSKGADRLVIVFRYALRTLC